MHCSLALQVLTNSFTLVNFFAFRLGFIILVFYKKRLLYQSYLRYVSWFPEVENLKNLNMLTKCLNFIIIGHLETDLPPDDFPLQVNLQFYLLTYIRVVGLNFIYFTAAITVITTLCSSGFISLAVTPSLKNIQSVQKYTLGIFAAQEFVSFPIFRHCASTICAQMPFRYFLLVCLFDE